MEISLYRNPSLHLNRKYHVEHEQYKRKCLGNNQVPLLFPCLPLPRPVLSCHSPHLISTHKISNLTKWLSLESFSCLLRSVCPPASTTTPLHRRGDWVQEGELLVGFLVQLKLPHALPTFLWRRYSQSKYTMPPSAVLCPLSAWGAHDRAAQR